MSSYFADTIGSFIRPQSIRDAREKFEKKQISTSDLQKIEDAEIKQLVEKQVASGLTVIGDGEFRRWGFWHDFLANLKGCRTDRRINIKAANLEAKKHFDPSTLGDVQIPYAEGKVGYNPNHPEFRAFEYLKSLTPAGVIAKVIVPTPNYLFVFRDLEKDLFPSCYKSVDEFIVDIAEAFKQSFLRFYELGARLIQIDEPALFVYGFLLDADAGGKATIFYQLLDYFVRTLKPAIEALPKDCKVSIHICRGNGNIKWNLPFGYKELLEPIASLNPNNLLLEWDDERSVDLNILKLYSERLPNTRFFLGAVCTKTNTVEKYEQIEAKIKQAATVVPLERLGVTTQCGFQTLITLINAAETNAQWGKIALLGELQKKLWGKYLVPLKK